MTLHSPPCRNRCRSGGRRRRTGLCLAQRCAGSPSCRPQTRQSSLQPSASSNTTRWRCAGWRPPPWSAWSPTCWTPSTRSLTLCLSSCPPTEPSPPPATSSSCCFRGEKMSTLRLCSIVLTCGPTQRDCKPTWRSLLLFDSFEDHWGFISMETLFLKKNITFSEMHYNAAFGWDEWYHPYLSIQ